MNIACQCDQGWEIHVPNRLPHYDVHNCSPEQFEALTEINAARGRAGRPMTPQFGMLLGAPEAARRIASLGAYCRYDSSLPDLVREAVTFAVASAKKSAYEADIHETFLRRLGASDDLIGALSTPREDRLPEDLLPAVSLALAMVRGEVVQCVMDRARAALGERSTLDVVVLTAYYVSLATIGAALTPDPITDPH